ncbi:MotA/TolQ/ExbB proton channel family protein [Virgibacillus sp. C22-A2]|uniref:MotA/TolQ/ExbB proton channel family protein n=1 Tax=Virgibacillus tibetensis TaxID=3042313 RepID=A0ABU6KI75_9BACI|nr:MotA/TolQ/ExbB proton channel family protein [Virgibacillus sp. C22-A2]
MVESILRLVTSEQKAEAILANPMIEFIFMILFVAFAVTLLLHVTLFSKLKKIRNYVKETNRMDIDPLNLFKEQFDKKQQTETVKVETFVQEKFSSWRVYHMPVVSLIKMIQMTVSIFILIGVLGTFIGLTISLGSINSDGDQLVENVAGVLSGIDVAFYTSIVGMGFSLIMTVLIKSLNTEYMLTDIMLKTESLLEGQEQNGISRLIDVSETINQSIVHLQETNQQSLQGIEAAFTGFQEYTAGLQESAKDLALFNEGLSDNLQEFHQLFYSMKEVTDGFGIGTAKLNKNFDALFTYFKKMDGRNERMAKAFENTYEKMQEVSNTQMETLHQFENSVVDLKNFTSSLLDSQESVQTTFEKINEKSNDLVEKMESHNKEFRQVFGDDLTSKLAGIMTYLRELSGDFDKMGDSIVKLPQALDVINQTQAEYKHLLSDRFQELKEFNRTFSNHLHAHSKDSQAFEKQVKDAANSYEQVGVKNNQLIYEINAAISQMTQSFTQRENQMKASVGILKDTLANYVANLEGTLGGKLDIVAGKIANSVEITNEGIAKEFREIRRVTEETQQSNARYTQQMLQELNREIQTLNQQLNSLGQLAGKWNTGPRLNQNEY